VNRITPFTIIIAILSPLVFAPGLAAAAVTVEAFAIEGLRSPASPKALRQALAKDSRINVLGLELKDTPSGWPLLTLEYDTAKITPEQIKQLIAGIEDPAGHHFKVHEGPLDPNAPLTDEEKQAAAQLGDDELPVPKIKNPQPATAESVQRGAELYRRHCSKCHGIRGNGYGPVMHGFTSLPSPLYDARKADDAYLFSVITNGRSDMPPWGIILSERDRWDLINYLKTLKKPYTD